MKKLMIVEDEILLRKALHKIISEDQLCEIVYEAANGKQALEYLASHKTDIIITDIRMPIMDGLEFIKQIKAFGIKSKVIVISGYNDFEYAQHMLKYGAFSYLLKPLVPEELLENIHSACQTLDKENFNLSIIKTHIFSSRNYAHFTEDCPQQLLDSTALSAFCIDFTRLPDAKTIADCQLELETLYFPCTCFQLEAYFYLVASFCDNSISQQNELAEKLSSYFSSRGMPARIAIGPTAASMMEIHDSMELARKCFQLQPHLQYGSVVHYNQLTLLEAESISYPLEKERELLNVVFSGQKKEIRHLLKEIHTVFGAQGKDVSYQLFMELCISCKHELSQYHLPDSQWKNLIRSISAYKPLPELFTCLGQILSRYHDSFGHAPCFSTHAAIEKAQAYIKQHSASPLTLDEVTEYCHLSKSHFCKLFKAETGYTFKAYLSLTRVKDAAVLLKTTNLRNYEVAAKVGIEDPSYFNELFKKITGFTPTEYRNQ